MIMVVDGHDADVDWTVLVCSELCEGWGQWRRGGLTIWGAGKGRVAAAVIGKGIT